MASNSLELIRRLEEEFSIYLPADDLRGVYTVGNLYNLLLGILKPTPDCLTSKAFYGIRTALVSTLGVSRNSIRPATFLDDLFDPNRIRVEWREVEQYSGFKMPGLRHTPVWKHWMQVISAIIAAVIALGSYRVLSIIPMINLDNPWVLTLLFFYGFALWGVLYSSLLKATPFRRCVLPTFTVGELARVVLSMNPGEFGQDTASASQLTRDQVWLRLVNVFCDMGHRPEDVVPSASIVGELVSD